MPPNVKVPHVVKEAVKAVERDIKPAAKLMAEIFLNTWLGDASILHGEAEAAKAGLPKIPKKASQARATPTSAPKKSEAIIIDAVLIDDDRTSRTSATLPNRDCLTCGNARKLGRVGHEIPCPSCAVK